MHKRKKLLVYFIIWGLCILLCYLFLSMFTRPGEPTVIEWDTVKAAGSDGVFRSTDFSADLLDGRLYRFSAVLDEEIPNSYLTFTMARDELTLFLGGEILYRSENASKGLSLTSESLPMPDSYAGETLVMLYRCTDDENRFTPILRLTSADIENSQAYAYANLTGIPAGIYAACFLLFSGLFLLNLYLKQDGLRLLPLIAALLILLVDEIVTSQGVFFLPRDLWTFLVSRPVSEFTRWCPIFLLLLYLFFIRKEHWKGTVAFALLAILGILAVGCTVSPQTRSHTFSLFFSLFVYRDFSLILYYIQLLLLMAACLAAVLLTGRTVARKSAEKKVMAVREQLALESLWAAEKNLRMESGRRHELRHNYELLALLYKEKRFDELGERLNGFCRELSQMAPLRYCDHFIVNALLQKTAAQARSLGIFFEAKASLPEQLPIDDMDLYGLLSNMLENALEATAGLSQSSRPFIRFHADQKESFLVIVCQNRFDIARLRVRRGQFLTSKTEKKDHGFGLRHMRDIAEKYHSTLTISYAGDLFTVKTALSLNLESDSGSDH